MKIGVGRVSTAEQKLDRQVDDLKAEGCDPIYLDKISGRKSELPELANALKAARPGDTMVFCSIDRIARTRKKIYAVAQELEDRGVELVILNPRIDTSTVGGKIVFAVLAALAEAEAQLISERTKSGLDAARARGKVGGRPRVATPELGHAAIDLYESTNLTWREVAKRLNVPPSTLWVARQMVDPAPVQESA